MQRYYEACVAKFGQEKADELRKGWKNALDNQSLPK